MSSSSNTGAQASMSSCYSMAAAYNLGDCPDANDVVRWAACGTSGGWAHTVIFTQQWCQRLKIDDSRSVHERRLVKKSILAATSLVPWHHDRCIVLLYIQPCGMIPHDYKYPIWLYYKMRNFEEEIQVLMFPSSWYATMLRACHWNWIQFLSEFKSTRPKLSPGQQISTKGCL